MSSDKNAVVAEYVKQCADTYTTSTVFQNWQKLCDNIIDASNQHYRPGEQLTRQGLYFGVMRAQRDGWIDGGLELFNQAKPLFVYSPKRGVDGFLTNRAQEIVQDIWRDIRGLLTWGQVWRDAVDYSMGIAYTKYCKYHGEYEMPRVVDDVYIDRLEWQPSFETTMDSPDYSRVHPYNYRCAFGGAAQPEWEIIEWEWSIADLKGMLGQPGTNQAAIKRIIKLLEEGKVGTKSKNGYHSEAVNRYGEKDPKSRVYAREFWGRLSGCEGHYGDQQEYAVVECEGELLRMNRNMLRIGRTYWRPIKRVRLDPLNDLPFGGHVLAPVLPHQRMKNLMNNLAADDLVIRQHLGLAVWPGALMNPNVLLNPEGAREPILMRGDASVNQIPRFFADQSSGVVRDVMAFDRDVIERDLQVAGLSYQTLGQGGGSQGKTATEQNYLFNAASRKIKYAVTNSIETGLDPIAQDLLGLFLRNNQPADLGLTPQEQLQLFNNNLFEFDTTLTSNLAAQAMALGQWGNVAMQEMAKITPASNPGSADHIVRFLKDMGKSMGLSTVSLDGYLPEAAPVQIPGPVGAPGAPVPPAPPAPPMPEMTEAASVV